MTRCLRPWPVSVSMSMSMAMAMSVSMAVCLCAMWSSDHPMLPGFAWSSRVRSRARRVCAGKVTRRGPNDHAMPMPVMVE